MKIVGKTLAERIKYARNQLSLTQTELAERADMSFRGLQNIEAGNVTPNADSLSGLAHALGVTMDELAGLSRQYNN